MAATGAYAAPEKVASLTEEPVCAALSKDNRLYPRCFRGGGCQTCRGIIYNQDFIVLKEFSFTLPEGYDE